MELGRRLNPYYRRYKINKKTICLVQISEENNNSQENNGLGKQFTRKQNLAYEFDNNAIFHKQTTYSA